MLRKISILCAVLALAGCDKPSSSDNEVHMDMPRANANAIYAPPPEMRSPPPPFVPPPDIIIGGRALFSLQHDLTLTMPHDSVAARFAAARDACLKDKALQCILTSASLTVEQTVSARLEVALPHDKVAPFESRLMKRLPQDGAGKVDVTSSSTTTQNETSAAADAERELAQAREYRDQLEELATRPNLTVDEVIKIHTELQQAQEALDAAEAAKRASDSKIVLERMNISFEEAAVPVTTDAFAGFWQNAHDVFMASVADMLLRLVNALPWLPIALVLAGIAARFMGRVRVVRTRRKAASGTATENTA